MKRSIAAAVVIVALFTGPVVPPPLAAQEGEPLGEALVEKVRSPSISLGLLVQFVADFQAKRTFPGRNGFQVANARLRLYGELDGGVGYLVQTSFGEILDARLSLALHPALALDGGLFKTPVSAEFLVPASAIDFVNRSRAVGALAPGRQVGMQARGALGGGLAYRLGVFNGQGDGTGDPEGRFLFAGRLTWEVLRADGSAPGLVVGLNAARNQGRGEVAGEGLELRFRDLRTLYGADARVVAGPWLVAGELLVGETEAPLSAEPAGGYLTLGFSPAPHLQALVRLERFSPDLPLEPDSELLLFGLNWWPTSVTELQVNVALPLEGPAGREPRLLVNTQVAF